MKNKSSNDTKSHLPLINIKAWGNLLLHSKTWRREQSKSSTKVEANRDGLALCLTLDQNDIITQFHFYSDPQCANPFWVPFCEALGRMAIGEELSMIAEISAMDVFSQIHEWLLEEELGQAEAGQWYNYISICETLWPLKFPLIPLPLQLLSDCYTDWTGKRYYLIDQWRLKNKELLQQHRHDDHLLCRCFPFFYGDARSLLKKNRRLGLKEVMEASKAGAACGECCEEIENAIDDLRLEEGIALYDENDPKEIEKLKRTKIDNKSNTQWVLLLDDFLQEFCEQQQVDRTGREIAGVLGHQVRLNGPWKKEELLNFKAFLQKKCQVQFHLLLN